MRVPQLNERVKEAPAHALRAVFGGIGSLLSVGDKIRNKPGRPGASCKRRDGSAEGRRAGRHRNARRHGNPRRHRDPRRHGNPRRHRDPRRHRNARGHGHTGRHRNSGRHRDPRRHRDP